MPIHLNLLAEQQAEEEARRRDPVRQAILAGAVAVALMVVWIVWLLCQLHLVVNLEIKTQEDSWRRLEANYNTMVGFTNDIAEIQKKIGRLYQLASNRFLMAPMLSALQFGMVDNICLNELELKQTVSKDVQNLKSGPRTIIQEHKTVILKGVVSNDFSGSQVLKFSNAVAQVPFFRDALLKTNGLIIKEFSPGLSPNDPAKRTGTFILECLFRPEER